MLSVGCQFPDFELTACISRDPKNAFETITCSKYPGRWVVYVFWPNDFTPICATELEAFSDFVPEFSDRDCVVLGGSVDSEYVHLAWVLFGKGPEVLTVPLLSDTKRELVGALGILDSRKGVASRGTFLVDPGQVIRHASVNDFSVGRNPKEILRILDALQTDALCPSRWEKGQPVIECPTAFIEKLQANAAVTR